MKVYARNVFDNTLMLTEVKHIDDNQLFLFEIISSS